LKHRMQAVAYRYSQQWPEDEGVPFAVVAGLANGRLTALLSPSLRVTYVAKGASQSVSTVGCLTWRQLDLELVERFEVQSGVGEPATAPYLGAFDSDLVHGAAIAAGFALAAYRPDEPSFAPGNTVRFRSDSDFFLQEPGGARLVVHHSAVLGAAPERHEEVKTGRLASVLIADPQGIVDPVHASIHSVSHRTFEIVDLSSQAGTFVRRDASEEWQKLPPRTATTLREHSRIMLGWQGPEYIFSNR
jgi:FHA domain